MKQLLPVTLSTVVFSSVLSGAAGAADLSAVPSGKYFVDPTHAYIHMQYSHLGLSNPILGFEEFKMSMDLDNYALTGDLTIKDTTKPVTLTVTVNNAMMHPMAKKPVVGISAYGGLKRSQWGLGANAPYISDEVKLEIQAELLQGE